MGSMDKSAENFVLANVLKELYLFDDGGMAEWIGDEVPAAKKRKAMSDVTSRFVNKLTLDFELKTMSKGFMQKSTCREKHNVGRAQFPVLVCLAREARQPSA